MKEKIKKLTILYLSLMCVFIIALCAAYAIPTKKITNHVRESIPQLQHEGVYTRIGINSPVSQLDNFTDAWMMSLAIGIDGANPIKSALENTYKQNSAAQHKLENLVMTIDDENANTMSYSRYWHGYLTFLKPLLVFLTYTEIRFLNMFGIFGLFIVVNCLIKKKLGLKYAASFFTAMMMVMILIVPMSLQFSSNFYIMFISMIILLLYYEKLQKNKSIMYLFFGIGAVTSFMDLLTFPIITLGIPLITYILLIDKESDLFTNIIEIIRNSILWGLGYGMTWATKWLIASIVLRKNIVADALSQILSRTSDIAGEVVFSKMDVITKNQELIFNHFTMKLFFIICIVWFIVFIFNRKNTIDIVKMLPIIVVAIFPYIWYLILGNHSFMHFWFTYKSQAITIFGVLALMAYCIDDSKINSQKRLSR